MNVGGGKLFFNIIKGLLLIGFIVTAAGCENNQHEEQIKLQEATIHELQKTLKDQNQKINQ